jgi:hypothetical protein
MYRSPRNDYGIPKPDNCVEMLWYGHGSAYALSHKSSTKMSSEQHRESPPFIFKNPLKGLCVQGDHCMSPDHYNKKVQAFADLLSSHVPALLRGPLRRLQLYQFHDQGALLRSGHAFQGLRGNWLSTPYHRGESRALTAHILASKPPALEASKGAMFIRRKKCSWFVAYNPFFEPFIALSSHICRQSSDNQSSGVRLMRGSRISSCTFGGHFPQQSSALINAADL